MQYNKYLYRSFKRTKKGLSRKSVDFFIQSVSKVFNIRNAINICLVRIDRCTL